MSYLMTLVLLILGFIIKRSRVLFVLQFIWLWILFGWLNGGPDYNEYSAMYSYFGNMSPNNFGTDYLYKLSCYIANSMGLSFRQYTIIVSLACLILIGSTVLKYSKNPNFVVSLFYLYPMIDSVIQMRNFVAMSIVIFSIRYLIDKKPNHKLKYVIAIIIAFGFHSISIVYFVMLFINALSIKKIIKIVISINIIGFVLLMYLPNIAGFFMSSDKLQTYFFDMDMRASVGKSLLFILWEIINILFIVIINKNQKKSVNKNLIKFGEICLKINLILSVFIPFLYYNSTFLRIFRNLIIFNFMYASNQKEVGEKWTLINVLYFIFIITTSLLMYVLLGDDTFNNVFRAVFESNYLFE